MSRQSFKHRVAPSRREEITISLPGRMLDRVRFLRGHVDVVDEEELIIRALALYDRVVCAVLLEGSRATIEHRSGSKELLEP